ncbi:UDP-N-acetylmuramoyl-L-alanine--D-glutamate ligase [Holospora curviuscula]|uniref:UDP-N-acetylmuramoylalanine--D-glutamate ligase n=1 Tax=Holospora curviuscula TaxID=1082868 RepID=A0A2S5R7K2_9PROT|nr:UDP-N-acetylmuramoyl-L-alanine--D-glutamate ligase [Holospora curviuscula]PPE03321.1 UDP-N-acetylmuramoylalanine--D-glutamate ligase [Holospora curviuscula]
MFSDNFEIFLLGLGHSGLATGLFFQANGIKVSGWDDEEVIRNQALDLGLSIIFNPYPKKFLYIVVSPGIPLTRLTSFYSICASGAGMITCDLGLFLILFPKAHVIGITGTNGKSTTCSLIAHVLQAQGIPHRLAGNIGVPIFSVASFHHPDLWYVLEWSSYQLELCAHHPWELKIGGILNLTPHHLERHGTMGAYSTIKRSLLEHSRHAIVDVSGPYIQHMLGQLNIESLMRLAPKNTQNEACVYYNFQGIQHENHYIRFPREDRFTSPAFQQNVAMTYAVLYHIPGTLVNFTDHLQTFQDLPHRQHCFMTHKNIRYIDDSKATTPEACVQALMRWSCPIFWIAGGAKQKDDLSVLKPALASVAQAFLYGESAERFQKFLEAHGVVCNAFIAMSDAVRAAWNTAYSHENAVVVCSPGCPSFDQFSNFVQRGKAFQRYIHQLVQTQYPQQKYYS